MAIVLTDTDPDAARFHLDLIRSAPPSRRLALALSLSQSVIALARHRALPASSAGDERSTGLRFVELAYGVELAAAVRERLRAFHP